MVQRFTDEQSASKLADRSIKVGDAAPRFTLLNATGKHVSLDRLLASGQAVVSFWHVTTSALELDIFRDEDIEYARRTAAAGVSTELTRTPACRTASRRSPSSPRLPAA
jgi:peroxiredoxin